MINMYESEWFGIAFKSFTKVNARVIASKDFYDLFYQEFYKRFETYEDLPISYKNGKNEIAEVVNELCTDNSLVSIGCGNGYVEHRLSEVYGRNIKAYEPSISKTCSWLTNLTNVSFFNEYFTSDSLKEPTFAYASLIDYSMNDKEYFELLNTIRKSNIKTFCLMGISTYKTTCKTEVKDILKKVLSFVRPHHWQLWGYYRTEKEHLKLFKKAGFDDIIFNKTPLGLPYVVLGNKAH